jgi:fructose-1,6-bisphosphatase I
LLNSLATAIKIISNQVNKGALVGALGNAGSEGGTVNVQGEAQRKLDVMSNDILIAQAMSAAAIWRAWCRKKTKTCIAIPDDRQARQVPAGLRPARRFFQHRRQHDGRQHLLHSARAEPRADASRDDFLQPAPASSAPAMRFTAPSTMLVLTTGEGRQRLHPGPRPGRLRAHPPAAAHPAETASSPSMHPTAAFWEPPVSRYVDECLAGRRRPARQAISTCAGSRPWWRKRTAS